jgi:hypothetical protein
MRSSALLLERRAFLAGFGALAATLAICPSPMIARAAARDTIYQRVWDADQATNGIPAIAVDQAGDPAPGFVKVGEQGGRDPDHRLSSCIAAATAAAYAPSFRALWASHEVRRCDAASRR